jgi:hypothetical protein
MIFTTGYQFEEGLPEMKGRSWPSLLSCFGIERRYLRLKLLRSVVTKALQINSGRTVGGWLSW